jgi:bleomycin hydrolase
VVGYKTMQDQDWFLIKDSGSGSRAGPHEGYYFYHEDYIKLKMMDYMIHRSAAEEILKKF